MGLSITLRICQNRQTRLRQANVLWGFCAFLFCFVFLKNEHIASEGISCLILFIAVRSRRCQKRVCLNGVGGRASWPPLRAPGSPITQSNWRQEDQGNLLCRSQSYKRTCPQQNMQEMWKSSTRSPGLLLAAAVFNGVLWVR